MTAARVIFAHTDLEAFRARIAGEAYQDYRTVLEAFRALPHQALTVFDDATLCESFLSELDLLVRYRPDMPVELMHGYSTVDHIVACATGHIEATLRGVKDWEASRVILAAVDAPSAMARLPNWCEQTTQEPRRLLHQLWFETIDGRKLIAEVYGQLLRELETRGALPAGTQRALTRAFEVYRRCRDDPGWPEEALPGTVDEFLLPLTKAEHEITRNLGAQLLGELYALANAEELRVMGAPTHTAMFERIAELDGKYGGIAAPFIDGARLQIEPVSTLDEFPHDADFDLRDWLLRLMRQDRDASPVIGQPLWFPFHEHFSADLDAAMRMIDSGKYFMAKMTAEEDWFSHMRQAVERIAREADEEMAANAKYSLEHFWPRNAVDR
ncbi:MAG: hypothetical protein AAF654_08825 [Myxococcota bacterium]